MVLVDSSVYIDLLRRGADPVRELSERFEVTEIAGCNLVRCEVLRGMVRPKARAYLAEFFDLLVHVTMDRSAWQETEELVWSLDRAGKVLPLTDVIIAVCALRADAEMVTRDRHFDMIPQLRFTPW